ncbi:MAG: NCS2 family permease [Candidatus Omnitrophica bacterium]|nr:NCS2 family permease [Candidatus Omnitrophota bacterium]MDD5538333.1 NCS2 family permease [Candidatus Omnitrophota bacterium]
MRSLLEKFFRLQESNTTVRTEVIGGLTTFMTMAYIIFVNPAMISQTGIDFGSAMMATCIAAAVATLVMGLYANYPIAQAPGMGENAFFTYTVCLTMGISWQVALGCVFIEGLIFMVLTVTRLRQRLIDAIPASLRYGTACGIGLLIAFIGLIDAGIVVAHPGTIVSLGDIVNPATALAAFGLIVTGVLLVKNIRGAMLWGILITTAIGAVMGIVKYQGLISLPPSLAPTFMKMDIAGALQLGLFSVVFIFLFMDIFDTVGTLAGVSEIGGFMRGGKLPRAGRAMMSDAVGTCVGAMCGTPTVTSYIESASGIASGARTGLASVVTAGAFLAALFFFPLIKMIGGGYAATDGVVLHPVTAPALVIVGSMMLHSISRIGWKDYTESIPAFLVIVIMPFTFSIATGIAFGFIAYAALKLFTGRGKEVSWLVYSLAMLFVLRFIYLKAI